MKTEVERIKEYYNSNPQHEWNRFDRHRFEFPVTLSFLLRHIGASPQKILDVGGGPGRYSYALKKQGHSVTLLDISEGNIEFAIQRAEIEKIKLEDAVVGDARDLTRFSDEAFDVVLNFGPLYHLSDEDSRTKAVEESLRVLKKGGLFACAFISKYAPIYDTVRRYSSEIEQRAPYLLKMIDEGIHSKENGGTGFTDALFVDPTDIKPYMESFGISTQTLFGAEGMTGQSEFRIMESEEAILKKWIDFAILTAETNAGVFGSDHIVYLGRK